MDVTHSLEKFTAPAEGLVLTIGNFDGVHRGHAALLGTAHSAARRLGAPVAVMTFHPHPLVVLAPERAPPVLTTLPEKLQLLERMGVRHTLVLRSEPTLLAHQAEDFLASLAAHLHPRAIVEGPDFNFGRGRGGSVQTLQDYAEQWGYEVHVVPAVHAAELASHPAVSSSSIRQALRDGRVEDANIMLGRPYRIVGRVGVGQQRGGTLGFPTANMEAIPHMLPQEAVYAAVAQLADGRLHLAAVNIGPQPTFAQMVSRVEAHLLDFNGDLRGRRLALHFFARLREQQRFAGVEALVAQLRRDVEATRARRGQLERLRADNPIPV